MNDLTNEAIKQGGVPDGYAEVVIEFFQFKTEGDKLEGRLLTKQQTSVRGNKVGKYTLKGSDGKRYSFLGGVHLDELLANLSLGSEVWIQYSHLEKIEDTGNELKRFKVFVKP